MIDVERKDMQVVVDGIVYGFQRYGGINTYFDELLPRIARRHCVTVEMFLPRGVMGWTPSPPVRILRRDWLPTRTGLSWRLDQLLHTRLENINVKLMELQMRRKKRCVFQSSYFTWVDSSVPQVALAHDLNHELYPELYADERGRWLRRQCRDFLGHATRIIAVSERTKQDIVRFYGLDPSTIDVVYHGTNRTIFYPDRDYTALALLRANTGLTSPYLLYVGGRWTYKNFRTLLEAFAQSSLKEKLMLAVAGPAWSQSEVQRLKELGLEAYVRLIPNPSDDDLRALYSAASAFVYPSCHEGFGIPLLEAMACGTLILASDTEVFREVAGDAAMYFNPNNATEISRMLEAALDEPTRREYIARGFDRVEQFSWDKCADQTYEIYEKALAAR